MRPGASNSPLSEVTSSAEVSSALRASAGTDAGVTIHEAATALDLPGIPTETPQFVFADSPELNGKLEAKVPAGSVIKLGLNLITAPEVEASEDDELEVAGDKVVNKTTGKSFATVPLPKARQAIIDAGGLIAYTRKRVMETAGRA